MQVFRDADLDQSGALSQKEIAKLLGEDHEFCKESREMLAEVNAKRPEAERQAEPTMTLEEFKAMMNRGDKPKTKTQGKRRQHAPVSSSQMVADQTV